MTSRATTSTGSIFVGATTGRARVIVSSADREGVRDQVIRFIPMHSPLLYNVERRNYMWPPFSVATIGQRR